MSTFVELVGDRVRHIRKLRGYTQEILAEKSGLKPTYISDVERGDRNVSLETLEKIILALEVDPIEIFRFFGANQEDNKKQRILDTIQIKLLNRSAIELQAIERILNEIIAVFNMK